MLVAVDAALSVGTVGVTLAKAVAAVPRIAAIKSVVRIIFFCSQSLKLGERLERPFVICAEAIVHLPFMRVDGCKMARDCVKLIL